MKLSSIIKTFQQDFLRIYGSKIGRRHRQALQAMKTCRTTQSPKMLVGCGECDNQVYVPHSCGHRNCPHCQAHESQQWLERQLKRQVPADYHLITFTLPAQFRGLAKQHQKEVYDLMIRACWDTLKTFSQNDKKLMGIPGAIAVLHTHSRELGFHPHVHIIIPAAAISADNEWRTKDTKPKNKDAKSYLFNTDSLASVFRAKILDGLNKLQIPRPAKYPKEWVVHSKAVGTGEKAIIYLGRYLYRGVIQEKDILSCAEGSVTYQFQNSKTKQMEVRTVKGVQFLRLLMQHILPKGFRRSRNFGFLHPNSKSMIALIQLKFKLDTNRALGWLKTRPQMVCSCCGGAMKVMATRIISSIHVSQPLPT